MESVPGIQSAANRCGYGRFVSSAIMTKRDISGTNKLRLQQCDGFQAYLET